MQPAVPPDQRSEAMSARLVALQLLSDILDKGHTLDQALDSSSAFRHLSSRDRAFARMLLTTTIRRLGQVDHLIIQMSDRGEAPSPPVLHHIVRCRFSSWMFRSMPLSIHQCG